MVEARGDNVTRSGERYDNHYCMVWRIENGQIKEIKEYCDSRGSSSVCSGRSRQSGRWRCLHPPLEQGNRMFGIVSK